ncbi:MAG TPA: YqiA/YcfP family alpha/beta fold hydrolase [Burkholderiaceae bacterium]|nr:YqiA/YcfP family alpha/beta fold hydrolase [Burkholderiaceae bacterium]
MSATSHVLYLHGFRSSPQSFKARMLHAWLQRHAPTVTWWCPQLPPSPRDAWQLMVDGTRDWPVSSMAALGSSLGGFYATAVAEHLGCRAVVLNPAVDPARDLVGYVGEQTAYHDPGVHFEFEAQYIDELRALRPPCLAHPERYAAVIAKGDELLDWREMAARYAGAEILLLDGSDHALSAFDRQMPFVLRFLGFAPTPS